MVSTLYVLYAQNKILSECLDCMSRDRNLNINHSSVHSDSCNVFIASVYVQRKHMDHRKETGESPVLFRMFSRHGKYAIAYQSGWSLAPTESKHRSEKLGQPPTFMCTTYAKRKSAQARHTNTAAMRVSDVTSMEWPWALHCRSSDSVKTTLQLLHRELLFHGWTCGMNPLRVVHLKIWIKMLKSFKLCICYPALMGVMYIKTCSTF